MNWHALFAIEGHGVYVWGSFCMCFTLMAAEAASLRRRLRNAQRQP